MGGEFELTIQQRSALTHQLLANTWVIVVPNMKNAHMVPVDKSAPLTTVMAMAGTVNMVVIVVRGKVAIGETATPDVATGATESIATVNIATVTAVLLDDPSLLPAESVAIVALHPVALDLAPRVVMMLLRPAVNLTAAEVGKLGV